MSEPLTIAVVAGIFGVLAGVPAAVSAYLSHKTRQENTDQHGQSQQKLDDLTKSVKDTGGKVDNLADRIDSLDGKHDRLSEKVHRHLGHHDAERELEED